MLYNAPKREENDLLETKKLHTTEKLQLGGVEQYIFIRADDTTKPVILFLHGGPGIPEYFIMKKETKELEKHFVMVYWDQRGAGKSYCKDKSKCNLTTEQLIEDTRELSSILATKFKQKKIYIMGHSWGSMLGLLTVSKYPESFFAYMGVGQVTNQYEAEIESLEWVKKRASELNDKRGLKKLNSLRVPKPSADVKEWDHYLRVHRSYLFKYGGTYHKKVSLMRLLKDVVFAQEYTLKEKMMLIPSALYSLKCLFKDVVTTNLFTEVASVEVPVYIFQGVYDYQVSYRLAKSYIKKLKAPHKELISFENSAHSPITEEYERFNEAVINIVKDCTNGI